jgi:hypothetical protein
LIFGWLLLSPGLALLRFGGFLTFVGVAIIVVLGLMYVLAFVGMVRPPVIIAIDQFGVRLGGSFRWAEWQVPWHAVASVRIHRLRTTPFSRGIRMLGLVPVDREASVWSRGWLRGTFNRGSASPASIADTSISLELEEVVDLMRGFRPDIRLEYGEPWVVGLRRTSERSWQKTTVETTEPSVPEPLIDEEDLDRIWREHGSDTSAAAERPSGLDASRRAPSSYG